MIIVFGSINMDMHMPVSRFPVAGETVLTERYVQYAGGKGANQAFAAARIGAKVAMVGCVGDDGIGLRITNGLRRSGVMTSGVAQSETLPTGLAFVLTDQTGENQVVVAVGANAQAKHDQVPDEVLRPKNILLLQMETTPSENWSLLDRAKKRGVTAMLNLAPAIDIPDTALEQLDYLIVNQIEARTLALQQGIDIDSSMETLAKNLVRQKAFTCIVTLGAKGSVAVTPDSQCIRVPALKIDHAVDTTGAGDAYCGTLAGALHEGHSLESAMRMASVAGSLSCLKHGTQSAFPYLGDIQEKLKELPLAP